MKLKDPPLLLRRDFDPVTLERLIAYAGASGEIGVLHYDRDAARDAGHEDVTAHGMYAAGLIGIGLAEQWGARSLRALSIRFTAPLVAGESPVLEVWEDDDSEQGRALGFALRVGERTVATGGAVLARGEA